MFVRLPQRDIQFPLSVELVQARGWVTNLLSNDLTKGVQKCIPHVELVEADGVVTDMWDLYPVAGQPIYSHLDMRTGAIDMVRPARERQLPGIDGPAL